ncbi:serine hydrolase [Bradyrhizobium jicamae]|uniref:serine hydrolase domain-containing protein n=1 Tax=Bradyrhizobium jicamae TaxID=280332 RepID=UPI001BAE16A2|nr:serine hydrolase domain-containing protein [Bradyrhizobium jicamae]MBR0936237.1 beta-lactamase family protein [Bradyrhizobium jicamae]
MGISPPHDTSAYFKGLAQAGRQIKAAARWAGFALVAALVAASLNSTFGGTPAAQSFSQPGLQRVGDYLRQEVAIGKIPGAILLIQQHGKPAYYEKFGLRDVTTKVPMTDDTIFRYYSMSKPITSVAALMLVDDGKLSLDDPLSKYIPAFADVKVGVEKPGETGKPEFALEPLERPITILDLMRQTSGITYGFYGDGPVQKLYRQADLYSGDFDNAEFAARLANLPLAEQPGTTWTYSHSVDVLGRVIEVASGQSLFQFEKERLLDPLGMSHTAFFVADEAKRPLVAQFLPDDLIEPPIAGIRDPMLHRRWESGGAGMVGTTGDYARFVQMLLNGGTLDGRRYLKPETVALMTSDQVGPGSGIAPSSIYFLAVHAGFGLGVAVLTSPQPKRPWPPGVYGWDGVAGTFFFVDPNDDLFVLCMMQSPSQRGRIETELAPLIFDAMVR